MKSERVARGLEELAASLRASAAEQKRADSEPVRRWLHEKAEERRIRDCIAAGVDPALGVTAALGRKLRAAEDGAADAA